MKRIWTYIERIVGVIGWLRREHKMRILASAMLEIACNILGMCLLFFENNCPRNSREVGVLEDKSSTHPDIEVLGESVSLLVVCSQVSSNRCT